MTYNKNRVIRVSMKKHRYRKANLVMSLDIVDRLTMTYLVWFVTPPRNMSKEG